MDSCTSDGPTPIFPPGISPERYAIPSRRSSPASRATSSASFATLSLRPDVSATARETATSSTSFIRNVRSALGPLEPVVREHVERLVRDEDPARRPLQRVGWPLLAGLPVEHGALARPGEEERVAGQMRTSCQVRALDAPGPERLGPLRRSQTARLGERRDLGSAEVEHVLTDTDQVIEGEQFAAVVEIVQRPVRAAPEHP